MYRIKHARPVLVVAVVALIAAVAGTALAGPTANNSSTAKVAKKALKLAKKNKKAIKNIPAGEKGDTGSKGDTGATGAAAASAWAKIDANDGGDAKLLGSEGVASVDDGNGTGHYNVNFVDSIVGCAWLATLNDNAEGLPPTGEIAINQQNVADPKGLQVRTFNSAGALTALGGGDGFSVAVLC